MDLKSKIRTVPHFPKQGIMFKDITTLLADKDALRYTIQKFKDYYNDKKIDVIAGPESRGFIFGAILAHELGVGFAPIRKPGKLPAEKVYEEYELEYGKDRIEMHKDAVQKGQRVLIVDDLLATGGTSRAAANLVKKLGGEVAGFAYLIELSFLKGREKLKDYDVYSLIDYEAE
ncbi:adenine phosphoribosyltransferase [Candidatus Woesearchaeota archaeon]|nr:adenine phosphoribosyltransferase [Candidatus Woesearchaeota archaeon]